MKIKPPVNSDTSTTAYRNSLSEKISNVYLTGKQTSSRKRRAVGSVESKVPLLVYLISVPYLFVKENVTM